MTLEQAIEQEKFLAEYYSRLNKIIHEENHIIFYDDNDEPKDVEVEYHKQVAEWLKELLLIRQTREKLNKNLQDDDIIICSKCGQKVIKSIRFNYKNFYCLCPYCGTQMNIDK